MDHWIKRFRSAKPIDEQQPVLIPGDLERESEIIRRKEGIPLVDAVVDDLKSIADKFSVQLPDYI